MIKTIIQRLQNLGFTVTSGVSLGKGGFIVRPIGRAKCESCEEQNLYSLYEVMRIEMCARNHVDHSIIMEWMDERENVLGVFCNTCGAFSQPDISEEDESESSKKTTTLPPLKGSTLFGRRLSGVSNITDIVLTMEKVYGELTHLSKDQLEYDIQRLEMRLEATKRELEKHKMYRD